VGRRGKGKSTIPTSPIGNARVEERLGNYCLVRKQKHNWKGERRSRVGFRRIGVGVSNKISRRLKEC